MIQQNLKIIEEKLLGENSIPVKLRSERFFDKEAFDELEKAILAVIDFYKDKSEVPKLLALCFVDISNFFFVYETYFSEEEVETIEDAGIRLSELANELFSD